MSTVQTKPTNSATSAIKTQVAAVATKPVPKKAPVQSTSAKQEVAKAGEMPVQNQIAPFSVKKKKNDKKVIRDSFSFPQQDYHKISELKKICLASGVNVKKGELLRAGLNLLTGLKLTELLEVVGNVEKVRTGRPKSKK